MACLLMASMEVKKAIKDDHETFLCTLDKLKPRMGQTLNSQTQAIYLMILTPSIILPKGAKMPNKPIYRHVPYMSQPELEELKQQLDDLIERGYIRPSSSPHGSPVLLVKKPGTTKMRLCVDFRILNSHTVKNVYPVPPIHDLLDRLHGKKVFSKIDLTSGFWQIRMSPESIPLTAFRTQFGLFEWLVVPIHGSIQFASNISEDDE